MTLVVSWGRLSLSYWRLLRANRGYRAMTAAMTLLLFVGTLRGGRETALAISNYRTAIADERRAWAENTEAEWLAAGVRKGRWLYLPALASQSLSEGVSKLQQSNCHVRVGVAPAHRLDLTDGFLSWTPELRRLGSLDLGYVVLFLLPLWALFVSYDSVCGEKLRGTLKFVLACGISRRRILLAKLASSFIAVWMPAVTAIQLGLVVATGIYHLPLPDASRWLAFVVLLTAYLAFYICVGVLASISTASSRTSLAVVMLVWVFCCFVQPRASMLAASLLRPLPSSVSFEIQKRAAMAEARRSYVEEHHSGSPQNWMIERLALAQGSIRREQSLQRVHEAGRAHSRDLADALLLLSPFGIAQSALVDIAGTSATRYQRFRQSCDEYRWRLTDHFASALRDSTLAGGTDASTDLSTGRARSLLDATPTFVFQDAEAAGFVGRVSRRGAVLFILALLLALYAGHGFTRYDAR